jgi:hypothetical protein
MVSDNGTLPADNLYFELKPGTTNLGEVDQFTLLSDSQNQMNSPDDSYQLFRIGGSAISWNIHAGIFDSVRLCISF